MKIFNGETFVGQEVILDGHSYINCTFDRCTLIFSAIKEVSLEGNQFNLNCTWDFRGPAGIALGFFGGISRSAPGLVNHWLGFGASMVTPPSN